MSARTVRAVVLGGTGFLGRHLCRHLARSGYEVLALARRPAPLPAGCRFQRLDLTGVAPDRLAALLAAERAAVVVNAAGALWEADDPAMVALNAAAVDILLTALGMLRPAPRLVHLGSVYEYGRQPEGAELTETSPADPRTTYARTKFRATQDILSAGGHVAALVLRLSTVIGPDAPRQSLLGQLAAQLAGHPADPVPLELPPLSGNRDFVDVRDVAGAVLAAARRPGVTGVLNIASGRLVPVRAAVRELIEISGRPVTAVTRLRGRPRRDDGFGAHRIVIDQARHRLGWTPTRGLTDALHALWAQASPPQKERP
ncbi:NAD(P)-dependent oxidoreductase [Crossiella sp. SN42]|uniref:NAD-dependent epimerase/dehydratase family protein n=1 Tax=Crossiella sp. SN42 TaxID=2944808 RepID=UPI00207C6DC8|nr:NAD(P)-dependent oxidoreductase [Crossiella sp. SN42]MCO1580331.1 NAD(P)-dependent oxidoreductase [Crossiella sp. SN42]